LDDAIDEHTHVGVVGDNGRELGECFVARYKQQDDLLQERGEGICPLEVDRDQVDSVAPYEVEGVHGVNGCTRSLGGMETPGPLELTRIPSAIVPVCVVKGTSVSKCVLKRVHSTSVMASVSKMACVGERPCMGEAPCVRGTACVRARYEREMAVGMQETATACPSEGVMARWVSVVNASVRA